MYLGVSDDGSVHGLKMSHFQVIILFYLFQEQSYFQLSGYGSLQILKLDKISWKLV